MQPYWNSLIEPLLDALAPRRIVETGAGSGELTRRLLDYCARHDGELHAVESDRTTRVGGWDAAVMPGLRLHLEPSGQVLPGLEPVDLAILDGDANYATVLADLRALFAAANAAGAPLPVVLVGRVGWPMARRDRYADPDRIPAEVRQPLAKGGLWPRFAAIRPEGGYGPAQWYAQAEGGEKNGVRTAIEAALTEQPGFQAMWIPGHEGMAVLCPEQRMQTQPELATWAQSWQMPEGVRRLMDSLELERLRLATQLVDHTVHFHRMDRVRQEQIAGLEAQVDNHTTSLAAVESVVDRMKGLLETVRENAPGRIAHGPMPPVERPTAGLMGTAPRRAANGAPAAEAPTPVAPTAPAR